MSFSRNQKRKFKPSSNGTPIVPLHKRKVNISMVNDGGYYEGMPGVNVDSNGNRKIIDFIVTSTGEFNAYIYAHPKIVKSAMQESMRHKELRSLMMSVFVDYIFKRKWNPLYWLVRFAFRIKRIYLSLKFKRKKLKESNNG